MTVCSTVKVRTASPTLMLLMMMMVLKLSSAQFQSTLIGRLTRQCECMEYWECIASGGEMYSYCSYSNKVCCFVDAHAHTVGILPELPKITKSSSCGVKGPNTDRDEETDASEWSWHAAVLEKPQDLYICGASLVDEYWVLTAAHCVDEYRTPSLLKVRLGEFDVSSTDEPYPHVEYDVSRIVVHPNFNNRTLLHDVALLRLRTPAKRQPNINVVCMPVDGDTNNYHIISRRCFVTGWGKRTEDGDHSVKLKEVNIPLWRNDDCERALKFHFGQGYRLPATSICAGAEGRDACDGDGGGPLACEKNGRWYQIGIVSFGIGCGRPNTPGIYTRVESYSNWIHKIVNRS